MLSESSFENVTFFFDLVAFLFCNLCSICIKHFGHRTKNQFLLVGWVMSGSAAVCRMEDPGLSDSCIHNIYTGYI